jgi:hypothetical protein
MPPNEDRPWEQEGDLPWDTPDPVDEELEADLEKKREAWRGDEHLGDWPENLAGPEYRLYRRDGLPP